MADGILFAKVTLWAMGMGRAAQEHQLRRRKTPCYKIDGVQSGRSTNGSLDRHILTTLPPRNRAWQQSHSRRSFS